MSELIDDVRRLKRIQHILGIFRRFNMRRLCEVGVREGRNLRRWLAAKPELLVGIDIWRDDGIPSRNDTKVPTERMEAMYQHLQSIAASHPCLQLMRMYSHEARRSFPDEHFDFVYLDADHSYEGVCDDLAWYYKVRPGGLFGGHDYWKFTPPGGVEFGVIKAVDEFVKAHHLESRFHVHPGAFPSWFIVKP